MVCYSMLEKAAILKFKMATIDVSRKIGDNSILLVEGIKM